MKRTSAIAIYWVMCTLATLAQAADEFPGKFLPQSTEPSFTSIEYKNIPPNVTMRVRMSSFEIVELLQSRYSGKFDPENSGIALSEEKAISYQGNYFRRAVFYFTELTSGGIHGHCGQWINVWLTPPGEIKGIYVSEPGCPL